MDSANAEDKEICIAFGIQWLERLFGEGSVERVKKPKGPDRLVVNYSKLTKEGFPRDELMQWLQTYLNSQMPGVEGQKRLMVYSDMEPNKLCIACDQFAHVSAVNALASLTFELMEHMLSQYHRRDRDMDPVLLQLRNVLPDIPVTSSKAVAKPLAVDVALAALKDVTGMEWVKRTFGKQDYYCTVDPVADHRALSAVLRRVLRVEHHDMPHHNIGGNALARINGTASLMIPANYLHCGNLGMLRDSKDQILPEFSKGRSGDAPGGTLGF